MSKRPRSPDPHGLPDAFPVSVNRFPSASLTFKPTNQREKVVIVDPSRKISALLVQIDQLKQEKSDLMSRSFAELQQREEKNRVLDVQVQQLMKEIEDLNKEADDLMVPPSLNPESTN